MPAALGTDLLASKAGLCPGSPKAPSSKHGAFEYPFLK